MTALVESPEIADAVPVRKARRGTTNRNERGSSHTRRARKQWLLDTYRANADADVLTPHFVFGVRPVALGQGFQACRCFRCGLLLTFETITVDRIKPGAEGGTYRRDNIRPACGDCNSELGAQLANARRAAKLSARGGKVKA